MNLAIPAMLLSVALAAMASVPDKALWPPIPPEVWAMKEATLPGDLGAMNLTRRLQVTNNRVVNEYRIRICSERGKGAAEFTSFPSDTQALVGRVVYPDGRVLPFDSDKDFHTKTTVATRYGETQEKLLVPPGLTDDCVVDIRWEEPKYWRYWVQQGRGSEAWDLAGPWPTGTLTVEVGLGGYYAWTFDPGLNMKAARADTKEFTVLTLKNVPASKATPFSLKVVRDIPRLKMYAQSKELMDASRVGKPVFWAKVVDLYKDFLTKNLTTGPLYKDFSERLRKDLPAGPQALAEELALRLQAKVRNLNRLSVEEWSAMNKTEMAEKILPKDLEAAVQRCSAFGDGITILYLKLLGEAGLTPKLALVANREKALFNPNDSNLNQLDNYLVEVEEPGKPAIFLDPSMRFAPPTLILPQYQATPALEVDMTTWTSKSINLLSQPPATNQRLDSYRLELLPDLDRFTLETNFKGYDDYDEKWAYMNLEPKEQNRKLREMSEDRLEGRVDKAEVLNARDPRQAIQFRLEGRLDRAVGRLRNVDPFPLTPYALDCPDNLADLRTELIVVPYLLERHAECRFKVPDGYAWNGMEPFEKANQFGSVSFRAEWAGEAEHREIVARMTVTVIRPLAATTEWNAFKSFLAWIKKADTTPIILEKKP